MIFIITYEPDGSIISSGQTNGSLADVTASTEELTIEADGIYNPAEYYVDLVNLVPVAKTPITSNTAITANVSTATALTGLPECDATYYAGTLSEGSPVVPSEAIATDSITDGELDVSADLAGDYSIVLTAPTYLDTTVLLTVQD